jgi:hypothetical protein
VPAVEAKPEMKADPATNGYSKPKSKDDTDFYYYNFKILI